MPVHAAGFLGHYSEVAEAFQRFLIAFSRTPDYIITDDDINTLPFTFISRSSLRNLALLDTPDWFRIFLTIETAGSLTEKVVKRPFCKYFC
jgi:hypothetical protein